MPGLKLNHVSKRGHWCIWLYDAIRWCHNYVCGKWKYKVLISIGHSHTTPKYDCSKQSNILYISVNNQLSSMVFIPLIWLVTAITAVLWKLQVAVGHEYFTWSTHYEGWTGTKQSCRSPQLQLQFWNMLIFVGISIAGQHNSSLESFIS